MVSWVVISLTFLGLKILMQERPEFVGQPLRVTKAGLVQESPQVFTRKVSEDVSVIRLVQADFSDVRFDMNGRRDYRGLRIIMDMSGQFRARHVVSNAFDEPIFVLFKCPHPRSQDGESQHLLAGEMKLPAFQSEDFRLKLPARARLISVFVNGVEVSAPAVKDQLCRIRLPVREAQQTAHRLSFRLSFRLAYPPLRLGFVGTAELTLPEVFQTAGKLEWVVALPNGFDTQVISSGLETQKAAPDLSRFGDYGRILKAQAHTHLTKSLAPPGTVSLSLKYRQALP